MPFTVNRTEASAEPPARGLAVRLDLLERRILQDLLLGETRNRAPNRQCNGN